MGMSNAGKGPWRPEEDANLLRLVAAQGCNCWVRIAVDMNGRTAKQCRERYHQNLKPTLNHAPITAEEGAMIEQLVAQVGHHWADIARRLGNRSDNAVKNWWNGSMNRRRRNPGHSVKQIGTRMQPLPAMGRARTPHRGARPSGPETWLTPREYGYVSADLQYNPQLASSGCLPSVRTSFPPMQLHPHQLSTMSSDPMHFQSRRHRSPKLSPESRQLPLPQPRDNNRSSGLPMLHPTFVSQCEKPQTSPVESEFSSHALPSLTSDSGTSTTSSPSGQILSSTLLPAPNTVSMPQRHNFEHRVGHTGKPVSCMAVPESIHSAGLASPYKSVYPEYRYSEPSIYGADSKDGLICHHGHSHSQSERAPRPPSPITSYTVTNRILTGHSPPNDSRRHVRGLWT